MIHVFNDSKDLDKLVAGLVFDLCNWMAKGRRISVGKGASPKPMMHAAEDFLKGLGIDTSEAEVYGKWLKTMRRDSINPDVLPSFMRAEIAQLPMLAEGSPEKTPEEPLPEGLKELEAMAPVVVTPCEYPCSEERNQCQGTTPDGACKAMNCCGPNETCNSEVCPGGPCPEP